MRRLLFTLISATSLLLFVLTMTLLVRSYWTGDLLQKGDTGSLVGNSPSAFDVQIESAKGLLLFRRFELQIYEAMPGYTYHRIRYMRLRHFDADQLFAETARAWAFRPTAGFGWKRETASGDYGKQSSIEISVPLWLIAIPFAVLPFRAVISWCRAKNRRANNGCTKCGYNLTGNASGVCPECGTKLSATSIASHR